MPTISTTARLAALAALALIPACGLPWHDPGGSQASYDEHTYISTPDSPKTIKVVDWTTNTTLWSIDLPIGHQVTIRFFEDFDPKNRERPDLMRWQVWDRPDLYGQLRSSMPVPDKNHRKIIWDHMERPAAPTPENAGTPPAAPPG
jgi:hypothetical protein